MLPLRQVLLPVLQERFPGRNLVIGEPPEPCAVFPGLHPGIRRVAIYDDGHELTVCLDDVTHSHFDVYGRRLTKREHAEQVVKMVVDFLTELFADRISVWGQHNMGGGWSQIDQGGEPDFWHGSPVFVWSGPWTPQRDEGTATSK